MGRPDYDTGDLVVCVQKFKNCPDIAPVVGSVWEVERINPPILSNGEWGVTLVGKSAAPYRGFLASHFRRIDPKPPEFWTGDVDVDAGEGVTA